MHSFQRILKKDGTNKVILDGVDVTSSCYGYSLNDEGNLPELIIRLACDVVEMDIEKTDALIHMK